MALCVKDYAQSQCSLHSVKNFFESSGTTRSNINIVFLNYLQMRYTYAIFFTMEDRPNWLKN